MRTGMANPDRQQATKAAQKAYMAALRAGLPVSLDDDTREVVVRIRYADEAEDEPNWEEA